MIILDTGVRVLTPNGPGTIAYKRMKAPSYSEPDIYSVKLDSKKGFPLYSGTIFPAEQIKLI